VEAHRVVTSRLPHPCLTEQLYEVCRRKTQEAKVNNVTEEGGDDNSMQVAEVLYVGEVSQAEVYKVTFRGHQHNVKT
jgi:Fe-S cluster assembly scaffold protein SufB